MEGMKESVDQVCMYVYICTHTHTHTHTVYVCMYVCMWARADWINPKGLVVMYSGILTYDSVMLSYANVCVYIYI